MVFSTHGWTKWQLEGRWALGSGRARQATEVNAWHRLRQLWLSWVLFAACWLPVQAADLQQLSLTRSSDGLLVSAAVNVVLAPSIEDALKRSVPLYFVVQAEVLRERWYWSDKRVAGASRTYRLAYQPLARHWRVSVASGSGPGGSLQYALHQNHDSLAVALSSITKLAGWQVAEVGRLDGESDLVLDFRFKLDLALLPKPFQFGMTTQNEWTQDVRKRMPVPELTDPPAAPPVPVGDVKPDGGAAPNPSGLGGRTS